MDRVDTASESGREGGREGGWVREGRVGVGVGGEGYSLRQGLHVYGLTQVRRDMRTGSYQNFTGSQRTGQAPAGPASGKQCLYFFCFRKFFFVSHFSFFKCTKKIRMFVYCHEIGT